MDRNADRTPTSRARTGPGDSRARSRIRLRAGRLLAALAIAAVALAGPMIVAPQSAFAATYPTWDELQASKANTAGAAAAVEQIKALIAELQVQVETTRAEAERRMLALQEAQQKYDDATRRAAEIQALADASAAAAATAKQNASQVAAQLYRAGGSDVGVNLLLDAGDALATDALLSKLGSMEKMVDRTSGIYEQAQTKTNTAQALGAQAEVAKAERETLRVAAEAAFVAAQEAQAAAENALAESQTKQIELDAQLAFLQDVEAKTATAYQEGERIRQEEERKRREEAMRSGALGVVASSGWARPVAGRVTDGFGPRDIICGGDGCSSGYHYAYDFGTGCSAPIYAANSGVVTMAGWSGPSYGNYIKIDHGGGISTAYAHIRPGGVFIGAGQWVEAGQNIASSGTTGASTGCHLHFEVWNGGSRINPGPFMADRGIDFG